MIRALVQFNVGVFIGFSLAAMCFGHVTAARVASLIGLLLVVVQIRMTDTDRKL